MFFTNRTFLAACLAASCLCGAAVGSAQASSGGVPHNLKALVLAVGTQCHTTKTALRKDDCEAAPTNSAQDRHSRGVPDNVLATCNALRPNPGDGPLKYVIILYHPTFNSMQCTWGKQTFGPVGVSVAIAVAHPGKFLLIDNCADFNQQFVSCVPEPDGVTVTKFYNFVAGQGGWERVTGTVDIAITRSATSRTSFLKNSAHDFAMFSQIENAMGVPE